MSKYSKNSKDTRDGDHKNFIKSIYRLRSSIDNFLVQHIEQCGAKGLMVSHGNILAQLYKKDRQPMSQIASDIGKCKSTLTVLVDKLEHAGYIRREVSTHDIRVKELCLTEKGKAFEENFWHISQKLNANLWDGFSSDEQDELLAFLSRIQGNMQKALTFTECKNKQL